MEQDEIGDAMLFCLEHADAAEEVGSNPHHCAPLFPSPRLVVVTEPHPFSPLPPPACRWSSTLRPRLNIWRRRRRSKLRACTSSPIFSTIVRRAYETPRNTGYCSAATLRPSSTTSTRRLKPSLAACVRSSSGCVRLASAHFWPAPLVGPLSLIPCRLPFLSPQRACMICIDAWRDWSLFTPSELNRLQLIFSEGKVAAVGLRLSWPQHKWHFRGFALRPNMLPIFCALDARRIRRPRLPRRERRSSRRPRPPRRWRLVGRRWRRKMRQGRSWMASPWRLATTWTGWRWTEPTKTTSMVFRCHSSSRYLTHIEGKL